MSQVSVSQIVTYTNGGAHIIVGSYTTEKGVSKRFTVDPEQETQLFTVDATSPENGGGGSIASDFSKGKNYTITLQRGKDKRYIKYPPGKTESVYVVDMNGVFEALPASTFVNNGQHIISVAYKIENSSNINSNQTSFDVAPDDRVTCRFVGLGGANTILLRRGKEKMHYKLLKEYDTDGIDLDALFSGSDKPRANGTK